MQLHALLIAISLVLATAVPTSAADWVAAKVSRKVEQSSDGVNWTRVRRGMPLARHNYLRTGRGARVMVRRGADQVTVSPHSLVWLTSLRAKHSKAKLTVQRGGFTMSVRKGKTRRVSVVTPHITAVVKGTTFTVKAGRRSTSLSVRSGTVDVSDNRTGATAQVSRGESVTSGRVSQAAVAASSKRSRTVATPSGRDNNSTRGMVSRTAPAPTVEAKSAAPAPVAASSGMSVTTAPQVARDYTTSVQARTKSITSTKGNGKVSVSFTTPSGRSKTISVGAAAADKAGGQNRANDDRRK